MEDNCVYARNLLGRLISTYGSASTHTYSQAQTPQPTNLLNPGTLMVIGAIILFLFLTLRNKKKTPQSKIQ